MANLGDLFFRLAEASQQKDLPFLLIGGHALNAYGYVRTTLDADLLIAETDAAAWRTLLESWGYRLRGQTKSFVQFSSPLNQPGLFPLDLMLVSSATFIKLSSEQRLSQFGSSSLFIPKPLHLIALKLHALHNPEQAHLGQDLSDVLNLLRVCQIPSDDTEFNPFFKPTRPRLFVMKLNNDSPAQSANFALPLLSATETPLPHPEPTWEQQMEHVAFLLAWHGDRLASLHPPRHDIRFEL